MIGDTTLDTGKRICHLILTNALNTLACTQPHTFHLTIAKKKTMEPNELNTFDLYCLVLLGWSQGRRVLRRPVNTFLCA